MDNTTIVVGIVGPVLGFLGTVVLLINNRKNTIATTEGVIAEQYYKLTERLREERNDLTQRIIKNEELITSLEKKHSNNKNEIKILKQDNLECKFLHEVAVLELSAVSKEVNFRNIQKHKVYLLDDDEDVIEEFKHRLNKLTIIDFKLFFDVDKFIDAVKKDRPEVIIVDYILNKGMTALNVVNSVIITYTPEIFIISSEVSFKNNFTGKQITFVEKDVNYVLQIVRDILAFLNKKLIQKL